MIRQTMARRVGMRRARDLPSTAGVPPAVGDPRVGALPILVDGGELVRGAELLAELRRRNPSAWVAVIDLAGLAARRRAEYLAVFDAELVAPSLPPMPELPAVR